MTWIMHSIDYMRLRSPNVRAITYVRNEKSPANPIPFLLGEPVIVDDRVITQAKIEEIIKLHKENVD